MAADRDETLVELERPPTAKPKPSRDHALQIGARQVI
jgi:hypothetical protein